MHMTEASTSFSPAEAFANLSVICSAALSLLFFSELGLARDLDGKYANSPLKQWFDSLASRRGPCCSVAEGQSIDEVDWDTKDGKYRVWLDGQWIEVPPDALVTVPNKFGLAVVWPYKDYGGARLAALRFLVTDASLLTNVPNEAGIAGLYAGNITVIGQEDAMGAVLVFEPSR
jgi:hypothetical protein